MDLSFVSFLGKKQIPRPVYTFGELHVQPSHSWKKNATYPNVYVHANLLHRLNAWIVGSR